jgi:hypothetical protein
MQDALGAVPGLLACTLLYQVYRFANCFLATVSITKWAYQR